MRNRTRAKSPVVPKKVAKLFNSDSKNTRNLVQNPLKTTNSVYTVPKDVLSIVFVYLNLQDLGAWWTTCKALNSFKFDKNFEKRYMGKEMSIALQRQFPTQTAAQLFQMQVNVRFHERPTRVDTWARYASRNSWLDIMSVDSWARMCRTVDRPHTVETSQIHDVHDVHDAYMYFLDAATGPFDCKRKPVQVFALAQNGIHSVTVKFGLPPYLAEWLISTRDGFEVNTWAYRMYAVCKRTGNTSKIGTLLEEHFMVENREHGDATVCYATPGVHETAASNHRLRAVWHLAIRRMHEIPNTITFPWTAYQPTTLILTLTSKRQATSPESRIGDIQGWLCATL
jgi:hypothetical protein